MQRSPDPDDHRVVRVRLTPHGEALLATLAAAHLDELRGLRRRLTP